MKEEADKDRKEKRMKQERTREYCQASPLLSSAYLLC